MPGMPGPVADEREGLLAFLAQQRTAIRNAAHGLTDEQARLTPTAGALSVGGLVKHAASMERTWMDTMLQRDAPPQDYDANFVLAPDETLAEAIASLDAVRLTLAGRGFVAAWQMACAQTS